MIKILIIEDDVTIVKNLSELLRQEGFDTDSALSCKEAETKIETTQFDLVLLDVLLPDGNGFSLCNRIKSVTDCPVIFLTASADEFSVVTGLDIGADDYIEKPYRPRELISRIKSVLRRTGKSQSIAIASVFIIVVLSMIYSIKKVNKENTVDTLRNENI